MWKICLLDTGMSVAGAAQGYCEQLPGDAGRVHDLRLIRGGIDRQAEEGRMDRKHSLGRNGGNRSAVFKEGIERPVDAPGYHIVRP